MQVTSEQLNPCTIKLSVVCEPAEVKEGFAKALKSIAKGMKIPGFRPGHAPKSMVESLISKDSLNSQAADEIVRAALVKALKQENIEPFPGNRPSVNLEKFDQASDACEFTAKIPLAPQIELGEYKGLTLDRTPVEVTDDEVNYQVEELRKKKSSRVAIESDHGIGEGDVAFVNVKPEGDAQGRSFMTVVGQTFPEMDKAITGLKVEEMRNAEITFPDSFQEKDWAGKKLKVQISLNSASSVQLPELNDDFAQTFKAENVDDLKGKIKEQLVIAKNQLAQDVLIEQAMEKLLAGSKVEVSDNSWEDIANRRLQETANEVRQKGQTMEKYAEENGMTLDQLVQAWQEKAQVYIKRAFLIRDIFAKEQMQLTNTDLNRELTEMAYEFQISPAEMFDALKKNKSLEELQFRGISRKVSDFLIEHADIKETASAGTKSRKTKSSSKSEAPAGAEA